MKASGKLLLIYVWLMLVACGVSEKNLISAVYNGDLGTVTAAIENGMDVNLKSKKAEVSLLSYAAGAGQLEVARYLLEQGADIDAVDKSGWSAVHFAVSKGQHEMIILLSKHHADLNKLSKDGWTPLMYAVFMNDFDSSLALLKQGADVSYQMQNGMDALGIAKEKGYGKLIVLLQAAQKAQS